jgi:hypothetical protein
MSVALVIAHLGVHCEAKHCSRESVYELRPAPKDFALNNQNIMAVVVVAFANIDDDAVTISDHAQELRSLLSGRHGPVLPEPQRPS